MRLMAQPGNPLRWTPFEEPAQTTLVRTGAIALAFGTVMFVVSAQRIRWPVAVLVGLWPAFGGHVIELWFLNWLRPRITPERLGQMVARLAVWSVGGIALAVMMRTTARVLDGADIPWLTMRLGAFAFIAIELVVHAALAARRQRSFYNGQG